MLLASSEYRHALETDIEPFKGLLLGLFFIAVGMSIDFGLVVARPLVLAGIAVGLIVLKGAALAAIAPCWRYRAKQRWLFAALLAQGGEFAFVVFGVARTAGVLPGDWEALLTLRRAVDGGDPVPADRARRRARPVGSARGRRRRDRRRFPRR